MKPPTASSEDHKEPSQAVRVQYPKRGAFPSPPSDIEKAPVFVPVHDTEDADGASPASKDGSPEHEG